MSGSSEYTRPIDFFFHSPFSFVHTRRRGYRFNLPFRVGYSIHPLRFCPLPRRGVETCFFCPLPVDFRGVDSFFLWGVETCFFCPLPVDFSGCVWGVGKTDLPEVERGVGIDFLPTPITSNFTVSTPLNFLGFHPPCHSSHSSHNARYHAL